jgi:uncharacterized protein (TIGR03000 family)
MTRRLLLIAALAVLLPAAEASAHHHTNPAHTYGVGVGFVFGGGYGPYFGPAFGLYPYYYQGFYGNGMSMYGPPVPTYSPVPGTFGGSDYRVNQNAPFFGMGLGWWGYRSPSPRPNANFIYNPIPASPPPPLLPPPEVAADGALPPADPDAAPEVPVPPVPAARANVPLTIEVRVPLANAIVYINDRPTHLTGEVRSYTSPVLPRGEYQYDVRAEWIINGRKVSRTQTVTGRPGERLLAEFAPE